MKQNRVYVVEFLFPLQNTNGIFGKVIFHCLNFECYIYGALLSLQVRKIPSALVLRLVKFLEGERHKSSQRAFNADAEEVHFWRE